MRRTGEDELRVEWSDPVQNDGRALWQTALTGFNGHFPWKRWVRELGAYRGDDGNRTVVV